VVGFLRVYWAIFCPIHAVRQHLLPDENWIFLNFSRSPFACPPEVKTLTEDDPKLNARSWLYAHNNPTHRIGVIANPARNL
jgi:hypothetical protein